MNRYRRQSTIKPRNAYARAKELPNLQTFAENLKTAVNRCLPSYQKPFGQVAVLAMHWQNNDIPGIPSMEAELLHVFRDTYNFNTESFEIVPHIQVQLNTVTRITNFLKKWLAEDSLVILIYSGHAGQSYSAYQGSTWETQ
jgi:hypothetical protein